MPTETEIEAVAKELFFCDHDGEWDDADGDTTEICRRNARAAIAALDAVRSQGRYRHKKRGSTYALIGTAEIQASAPVNEGEPVAVYRCDADGRLWARPLDEFNDGRFGRISEAAPAELKTAILAVTQLEHAVRER